MKMKYHSKDHFLHRNSNEIAFLDRPICHGDQEGNDLEPLVEYGLRSKHAAPKQHTVVM